ncbi:DUF4136 domain-containing protein [Subsaximicrobium wynnwilliamsii]|uniref:DUF4136 domain-containing protein n=1 Tax=Subsaximicrobium wynnwilliamsii TaxID=291179 RepID=A0A5C6ZLZ8_9FLAO|nr:DUF4136 domain-containing protein [Subsaximicrobium wynnwilliamsii]TXD85375.1 DUF4136 domain-containing protein [Subsaximicrobium wynnwilliamsii]TXD90728.1 DUF4136 domain-containing protein [Subsaximicrobium wynnwilliamsii]TXE05235.1 DUF4136 domain-containing protein [Subsaximicrobium wynnwilliamsii]
MKKLIKFLPVVMIAAVLTSCNSVKVAADYDKQVDFNTYKTFAFFKTGIDKAEISDLDKRRILRAIEAELFAKGLIKSENPDMLVSIFTKSQQRVDIYNNNWGWGGWGWGGFGWGGFGPGWGGFGPGFGWNNQPLVSTTNEGTLFIDFIDANKKELVWQGSGTGYLPSKMEKKDERIKEFVSKMMEKYPPGMNK